MAQLNTSSNNCTSENDISSLQLSHTQLLGSLAFNSGFDYEFIDKVDQKYECAICLLALRNPTQTSCGHRFCRDCILSCISGCNKECPIDKQPLTESNLFHDSCIEREILQLKVKCPNSSLGCKSQIDLRYIEAHIHACVYQPVLCPNECSVTIMHKELEDHLTNQCLYRLAKCKYCSKTFTYNLEQVHLADCPYVSVACECGKEMQRAKIAEHKGESCPLTEVSCSFVEHGCQFKASRNDMRKHTKESIGYHIQLLSAAYKKINTLVLDLYRNVGQVATGTFSRQPSLRSQISQSSGTEGQHSPSHPERTLEGSLGGAVGGHGFLLGNFQNIYPLMEGKTDVKEIYPLMEGKNNVRDTSEVESMQQSLLDAKKDLKTKDDDIKSERGADPPTTEKLLCSLSEKCTDFDQRIVEEMIRVDNLIRKIDLIGQNLRNLSIEMNGKFCNGTLVWKIPNFREICSEMEKKKVFYSVPFYSSQFGYRFCLRTNLSNSDEENFLTLYIHMMQSENDDFLPWPFQGKISLAILDCKESYNKCHFVENMEVNSTMEAFKRPKAIRSVKGYGFKEFISLNQIFKPSQSCEYVKNNILYIKAKVSVHNVI